jgi:hypothetical protein
MTMEDKKILSLFFPYLGFNFVIVMLEDCIVTTLVIHST